MSHIEQCPRCELRFRSESEMRWHLQEDHGGDAQALAAALERTEVERHRSLRRRQRAAQRGVAGPPTSEPKAGRGEGS